MADQAQIENNLKTQGDDLAPAFGNTILLRLIDSSFLSGKGKKQTSTIPGIHFPGTTKPQSKTDRHESRVEGKTNIELLTGEANVQVKNVALTWLRGDLAIQEQFFVATIKGDTTRAGVPRVTEAWKTTVVADAPVEENAERDLAIQERCFSESPLALWSVNVFQNATGVLTVNATRQSTPPLEGEPVAYLTLDYDEDTNEVDIWLSDGGNTEVLDPNEHNASVAYFWAPERAVQQAGQTLNKEIAGLIDQGKGEEITVEGLKKLWRDVAKATLEDFGYDPDEAESKAGELLTERSAKYWDKKMKKARPAQAS